MARKRFTSTPGLPGVPASPRARSGVWFPVSSSAVLAVGRFGSDLGVTFVKGKAYHYRGAGSRLEEILALEATGGSVGVFVNFEIKPYYAVK